jgi:hypothetical protein
MSSRAAVLGLAAAATLAVVATGCPGKNCGDETPPVSQAPASCSAQAGAQVTVPLHVCPKCDQATPTCLVRMDAAGGVITLEPVSEVCDPSSSCPIVDPSSCPFATLDCSFTAPAAAGYSVTVVTPSAPIQFPLTVSGGGSAPQPVTCPL